AEKRRFSTRLGRVEGRIASENHPLSLTELLGTSEPARSEPFFNKLLELLRGEGTGLDPIQLPNIVNLRSLFPQFGDPVESEDYRRRVLETMDSLRQLGRHLAGVPGRKSVIWMTRGFSLTLLRLKIQPFLWHDTLQILNDSNVAVYSVDSAGLRTVVSLAEQPGGRRPVFHTRSGVSGAMSDTDVLFALAEETGGRAYVSSNDLGKGIKAALQESQYAYRLAYSPHPEKWDGSYVRVQVRVNRPDVLVRHRRGYFAKKDDNFAPALRRKALDDVMQGPLDALQIEMAARVKEKSTLVSGTQQVRLRIVAAPGSVSLLEQSGTYVGAFDVRIAQRTLEGSVLEDFTDEIPLKLTNDEAERTRVEGFAYERTVTLQPNAVALKIALLDTRTGRVGSVLLPVK
ncbi:MAG: VWA domain-containing protein, partial [Bryobacteraceae bacterium]|nr:VWA domain-containing protein [Bryobacteraceae bacterium]